MHDEAHDFVAHAVATFGPFGSTVEFGSADVNGSIRSLFDGEYLGIDIAQANGVDVVANAAEWDGGGRFDCVVCCEVFEHTDDWQQIVASAFQALRRGGYFIVTCAGPGRGPHSAIDGNAVREGEFYANVEPYDLNLCLIECGFDGVYVEKMGLDVRATARKP